MKSASTLIALHTRATCVLELLQKAEDKIKHQKDCLKYWDDNKEWKLLYRPFKCREDCISAIITANRIYIRIKHYYFTLVNRLS